MELNRYGNMLQHNQWFLFFIQIHSYIASKIHLSHRISWILILPTIIKAELVKIPFPFHCTSIIVALESRIVSNVRIMPNGFFQKKRKGSAETGWRATLKGSSKPILVRHLSRFKAFYLRPIPKKWTTGFIENGSRRKQTRKLRWKFFFAQHLLFLFSPSLYPELFWTLDLWLIQI